MVASRKLIGIALLLLRLIRLWLRQWGRLLNLTPRVKMVLLVRLVRGLVLILSLTMTVILLSMVVLTRGIWRSLLRKLI